MSSPVFLSERALRNADRTFLAVACVISAYLLAQLVAFHYGRDQPIYFLVGETILRGGMPYRDLWDIKPPGIYLLYASTQLLLGSSVHAIRIVEAASLISLFGAFAILSRRFAGSTAPGILAGAVAVLVHVRLEFWSTAQPESFGAVLLAWALVLADPGSDQGPRSRERWSWLGAGALLGFAVLLKPTLGAGLVVLVAALALGRKGPTRRSGRNRVRRALLLGAGAAFPLVATAGWFVGRGAWTDLYEAVFVFAPRYTGLVLTPARLPGFCGLALKRFLLDFSAILPAGFLLLGLLPPLGPRERGGIRLVAATILLLLSGVAVQAKFVSYHFGAALPLGALLAGWGLWKLWIRARRSWLGIVAGIVGLGVLGALPRPDAGEIPFWERCAMRTRAWLSPATAHEVNDRLSSRGDLDAAENRRVAAWLRENTSESDPVYIWGVEPGIYFLSGRRPPTRYLFNFPQRVPWNKGFARVDLLGDLNRNPPAAIVLESRDVFPWVTGDLVDSRGALQDFPPLRQWIESRYSHEGRIGDFDLYLRIRRDE